MSLLDTGTEQIVIFPEEAVLDADGNIQTRASQTGVCAIARIQPLTLGKNERDDEGFETEQTYSLRLPRNIRCRMGAQTQIEWHGERWVVFGDAFRYNSSPRTAHHTYKIKRY